MENKNKKLLIYIIALIFLGGMHFLVRKLSPDPKLAEAVDFLAMILATGSTFIIAKHLKIFRIPAIFTFFAMIFVGFFS